MRLRKIIGIAGAVLVVGFLMISVPFSLAVSEEEAARKFITANPLDLEQIFALSQYRSCAGHDYRGPTIAGEVEKTPRSLKHYVKAKPQFRGTVDEVAAYAPFDGKISVIDDDAGGPGDQQIWLAPESKSPRQWHFIFFHINLKPGLQKGSKVKAGELVGIANLGRGPDGATDNFDIAVKLTRPLHRPAVDTPFHHMSESVLSEYARYGITPDRMEIPESDRDLRDCPVDPSINFGGRDVYFSREAGANEYVNLRPLKN